MYSDIKLALAIVAIFIVIMIASYRRCKPVFDQLQKRFNEHRSIVAINKQFHWYGLLLRVVGVVLAIKALLLFWPETLQDSGTLAKKVFDEQGKCIVYMLDPVGVLSEGYSIDPTESLETAFFLHCVEVDNPFTVTRRADLPQRGPVAATDFSAGFAVSRITGTVMSIEPWEHGYLLKLANHPTQFRVWSYRTPEWEQQFRDGSIVGKDLMLMVNQNRQHGKRITEVAGVDLPIRAKPHIMEDGTTLG